jgi:hypothetical protein
MPPAAAQGLVQALGGGLPCLLGHPALWACLEANPEHSGPAADPESTVRLYSEFYGPDSYPQTARQEIDGRKPASTLNWTNSRGYRPSSRLHLSSRGR